MRWRTTFQLGVKELRAFWRDRMLLGFVIYAFAFAPYIVSQSAPEALNRASIAVIDEDRSPLSRQIAAAFHPPYFLAPAQIERDEMERRMDAGLDTFAMTIPEDFQRDLVAGRRPEIQLNMDATRTTQAFTGSAYVQAIVSREVSEFVAGRSSGGASSPINLVVRARFNPELDRGWFVSIMNLISSVTMLAIILSGAALIREREHGTVEHLLVMPVTPTEIMLAKIWSMSAVVFVATAASIIVVIRGVLDVPIHGSVALFLAGAALHMFATTCLGVFLATNAGSMPQFALLLMLVLLPLQVLSGEMTPRESMPEALQTLMLAAPNTHFVALAQAILYRGAGLDVVWPNFLALIAIAVSLFLISLWRFRRTLR